MNLTYYPPPLTLFNLTFRPAVLVVRVTAFFIPAESFFSRCSRHVAGAREMALGFEVSGLFVGREYFLRAVVKPPVSQVLTAFVWTDTIK